MKELVKYSRVCGYLEKIYRQLNQDFFSGELEEPIITVCPTPDAYGHVTEAKIWKTRDNNRYELNISANSLSRSIDDIVETMLHEMVHIYNLMHDIQDCSRGGTYHNKKFKEKAESIGLEVARDEKYGYAFTLLTEPIIDYIATQGWTEILINRGRTKYGFCTGSKDNHSIDDDTPKKTSSTRKYICPHCNTSVRATKEVHIICADCTELMQLVQN